MKILGFDYTLKWGTAAEMDGVFGTHRPLDLTILIRKDIAAQQVVETLLHEIIEATNHQLELEMRHNVISAVSMALYQTLRDNGVDLTTLVRELGAKHA